VVVSKVEYELMTPTEIVQARDRLPLAFVPLGPIEWHGPHLPLGTDAIHAGYVASQLARDLGGVVLPTFFMGTETVRLPGTGPEELGALGLDDDARVVGMDLPANPVKSLYFEEGAFAVSVREIVRGLKDDAWRLIVLVNGHGAVNHQRTLERIAREETRLPDVRVLNLMAWTAPAPPSQGPGHADREETAVMMAIAGDLVRLDQLPPLETPLRYTDYGIVDSAAFDGYPGPDFLLPQGADPRLATPEEGEEIVAQELAAARATVLQELAALGLGSDLQV
jgi:creatinine amidohydrolase